MATAEKDVPVSSTENCIKKGNRWLPAFAVVVITAIATRLYQLDTESLWVDEGFSLQDAVSYSSSTRLSKPFFYWLLSIWMQIGDSDWFLRLLSVIFGVAAVVMIFIISRMLWNTRAAAVTGLLIAVSPFQVDLSQEVRMYSLVMFLVMVSVYWFLVALRTWKLRHLAACGVFLLLAVLTHPLCVLMLIPFNMAVIDKYLKDRMSLLPWIGVQLFVLAYWSPFLPYVLRFREGYEADRSIAMMEKPSLIDAFKLLGRLIAGVRIDYSRLFKVFYYIYAVGIYAMVAVAALRYRRNIFTRFTVAWLILPLAAVIILFSNQGDAWRPRHMMFISGALFLLIGGACSRIENRRLYALALIFVLSVPAVRLSVYYRSIYRADWRSAVHYLTVNQKPDDLITIYRKSNECVFRHYYKGHAHWFMMLPRYFLSDPTKEFQMWDEEKALQFLRKVPKRDRQWLALARTPRGADAVIDSAIKSHYRVLDSKEFEGIRLYLFTVKD